MDEQIFFNGIGEDGEYLREPRPIRLPPPDQRTQREVRDGIDVKELSQAGWGVVFAEQNRKNAAIREALLPLLKHRRKEASRLDERRYQEYIDENGYRRGDGKQEFMEARKSGPGPVDPDSVPYYLLIVGDPKAIPYPFQYQLDVPCAVGRIHFDSLDEYERYARSVVESETRPPERPRKFVLFGPSHPNEPATRISREELLVPLASRLRQWLACDVSTEFAEAATRARLGDLLGGADTPSVLFTGGHGVGFGFGRPEQRELQGALLCQDWPGPGHRLQRGFYFAAEDLDSTARLAGLITFHFACYSAGTPVYDGFADLRKVKIAPEPFIARLPQRMLAQPAGGALAVVGHVDQACQSSFLWKTAGSQITTFAQALYRLDQDYPLGAALEPLNQRYAELTADLCNTRDLAETRGRSKEAREKISFLRMACQDARNYVIVGDPAVRLPTKPKKERVWRGVPG